MAIATKQVEAMGARIYAPEGPYGAFGNFPGPSQGFGYVVMGDNESEFIFLKYAPTTAVTYNQGDVFFWDTNFIAYPILSGSAQYATPMGTNAGTLFLGGRLGDPAADVTGNIWSFQFAAGSVYGIWVQRAGATALNVSVTTHQYSVPSTCATAGSLACPTASTHYSTFGTGSIGFNSTSTTVTATTTSGSSQLTSLTPALGAALEQIQLGDYASGTGIPNGAYVTDINGTNGSITLSAAATSSNSGETTTFTRGTLWGTIPVASASGPSQIFCANIPAGVYPNCTISGTGLSSTTITSITGTPGNFIVTVAGASTQELTIEQFTITGYYEGFLRWPFVTAST